MKIVTSVAAIAMLTAVLPGQSEAQSLSESDRKAIVQEVIEHFREHPAELVDAIITWREKQESARKQMAFPTAGDLSGDVTIFEFSDYGCDPCRKLSSLVDDVASKDGNIRVVLHDYPVSSKEAVAASLELVAVYEAGENWQELRRSYIKDGVLPEYRIQALDKLDIKIPDSSKAKARQVLVSNRELALKVGVKELPAIILSAGGKVQALSGLLTAYEIEAAIRRLREEVSGD